MLIEWLLPLLIFSSFEPAQQTVRALLNQENFMEACLMRMVQEGARKAPLEALTCAHAHACSQAHGGAKTSETAGCLDRSMDTLVEAAQFEASLQDELHKTQEAMGQYWRSAGALPERVESCATAAKAMFCAEINGSIWKQMVTYEAYRRRCSLDFLRDARPASPADDSSPAPHR